MLNSGTRQYPAASGPEGFGVQSSAGSRDLLVRADSTSAGSQYPLHQQHGQPAVAQNAHEPHFDGSRGPAVPTVRFTTQIGSTRSNPQVRRRISRACDSCNLLRTKCDGEQPCAHCEELGLTCAYERAKKKRGKAARKDVTAQQTEATLQEAEDPTPTPPLADGETGEQPAEPKQQVPRGIKRKQARGDVEPPLPPPPAPLSHRGSVTSQPSVSDFAYGFHNPEQLNAATNGGVSAFPVPQLASAGMPEEIMHGMSGYRSVDVDDYQRSNLYSEATFNAQHTSRASSMLDPMVQTTGLSDYQEHQYGVGLQDAHQGIPTGQYIGGSPLSSGLVGRSVSGGSPRWVPLRSPSATANPNIQDPAPGQALRYPVLQPLLPYIADIIPIDLACDLLESYFSSTSSVYLHPQSPYVLGYVFRKRSFLRFRDPRPCTPALLASMLWIAAQSSDSPFLNSPPGSRGNTCQRLLEVTIQHLNPLVHAPAGGLSNYGVSTEFNNIALGGFGVAIPGQAQEMDGGPGASGSLDDVATYLHLATVVSASEYKAASLRWWNSAWSLARELKLNKELPPNGTSEKSPTPVNPQDSGSAAASHQTDGRPYRVVHEEEREERRRVWWILYSMDRHLALCYNRPLFLLDSECANLLQPEEHIDWPASEYHDRNGKEIGTSRRTGPPLECYGQSVFGYFLPLMTILGEIVELKRARDHPRFGTDFHNDEYWKSQIQGISWQLEAYGESLKRFETQHTGTQHESNTDPSGKHPIPQEWAHFNDDSASNQSGGANHIGQKLTETNWRAKIVVLYGTYLMHTLHILLNGKWDPISLLDNEDEWISTPSFISATGHAVDACEALEGILEHDPDLSCMPFFFGMYLLQGSFLLLLIADKLQGAASPGIIKACETIVRAHEACIVTLSTEYQRNFRKVMRSALAQVRGRVPDDVGEAENRRRKVLALYRWTRDGTGLAL